MAVKEKIRIRLQSYDAQLIDAAVIAAVVIVAEHQEEMALVLEQLSVQLHLYYFAATSELSSVSVHQKLS